MTITTQRSYAPRTRGGLLISCLGFAALAASTVVPALTAAVGPAMGLGFVIAILVIVAVPRMITPGPTWTRAALPGTFATIVFIGSGAVALAAVAMHMAVGSSVWGHVATAAIIVGAVSVASVPPRGARRPRS